MFLTHFLEWLRDTPFSTVMRESLWAEPIVETIHVLTLTLFLGFAVLLDMRLLGLALRRRPASQLLDQMNPWLVSGFAVMVTTGILLFCGDPVSFYTTTFFKLKMILLLLAGLNVLIFNKTVRRQLGDGDVSPKTPTGAKVAAIISLILWVLIVAAGRGIAYALPPP